MRCSVSQSLTSHPICITPSTFSLLSHAYLGRLLLKLEMLPCCVMIQVVNLLYTKGEAQSHAAQLGSCNASLLGLLAEFIRSNTVWETGVVVGPCWVF